MDINKLIETIKNIDYITLFENGFIYIKSFLWLMYDFLYPFFIKYILFLKEYSLLSLFILLIIFNITYYFYVKINNKNFSVWLYLLNTILLPLSVIIYFILLINSLFKYILFKISWLNYPYIPYKVKKDMEELDNILNLKNNYLDRFKK